MEGRNRRQDTSHPVPNTFQCEGTVRGVSIIFFMVSLQGEKTLILIQFNSSVFSCVDPGLGVACEELDLDQGCRHSPVFSCNELGPGPNAAPPGTDLLVERGLGAQALGASCLIR